MAIDVLFEPAALPFPPEGGAINKLMHFIWMARPDLRAAFDLSGAQGQSDYCAWFAASAERDYGLDPVTFQPIVAQMPANGPRFLSRLFNLPGRPAKPPQPKAGATLIGYAKGVLGMGEHVRMSATALHGTNIDFGIFDVSDVVRNVDQTAASGFRNVSSNFFDISVFHVNADQIVPTYFKLGRDFFKDRYNIGFWAWELETCPPEWSIVADIMDEIWAPSRFIQEAFAKITTKPVNFMPLCVELPDFQRRDRSWFDLPQNAYLFYFAFDGNSFIDRKNPSAMIRAFKQAFPASVRDVGLVVKIMNSDAVSEKWNRFLDEVASDDRIIVIDAIMTRHDVLALFDCCDCFVSLHRSEGFGRAPAEAMHLGKPTIVTNYSGNTDFTRSGGSLLVDYTLVPVEPGEYVYADGCFWADPDIDHAAFQMRRAYERNPEILAIAARGQDIIKTEFDRNAIASRMQERLHAISVERSQAR